MTEPYRMHLTPLNWIFLRLGGAVAHVGNMIEQFNIPNTLYSRGFVNVTEGDIEETLLNKNASPIFNVKHQANPRQKFIEKFNDKLFRSEIKKMIYSGIESTQEEIKQYCFEKSENNQNRYTKTVELLIAYLCVKELKAFSASFGIQMDGTPDGGDYDCISNFQNQLVYFEVKSGKAENIKSDTLQYFLNRHNFLAPHFSVLFVDYEGGKDKLDPFVTQFRNLKIDGENKISLLRKVTFGSQKFYVIAPDIIVVDMHRGSILSNLRLAMQYIHRYNAFNKNIYFKLQPDFLGYEYVEL